MRSAQVLYNGKLAGILSKQDGAYRFVYDKNYMAAAGSRPVSLTLPFRDVPYESDVLFPAFVNMLSEGDNKALQNRLLEIDERDYFSLLLAYRSDAHAKEITKEEMDVLVLHIMCWEQSV